MCCWVSVAVWVQKFRLVQVRDVCTVMCKFFVGVGPPAGVLLLQSFILTGAPGVRDCRCRVHAGCNSAIKPVLLDALSHMRSEHPRAGTGVIISARAVFTWWVSGLA